MKAYPVLGKQVRLVRRDETFLKSLNGQILLKNAKVFSNLNRFKNSDVCIKDGCFLDKDVFERSIDKSSEVQVYDLNGAYITPNLFDQHIHGGYGVDFNTSNESEIRDFLKNAKKAGIGGVLATLTPATIDKLNTQIELINKIIASPKNDEAQIFGINLEGPFFSPLKSGIHLPDVLLKPTVENLNKINLENVKMVTVAPELDDNYSAINYLNSLGIVTSAGHCTANAEQVRNSGVKCITHLFNAMPGFHHREPTIVNEGLQNDDIYTEVNTAFELLEPKTINMIYKLKPHDKIILISDSLKGVKNNEKTFMMGGKEIIIDDNGIAKDADGILAGSIKLLGEVAKKLVDSTLLSFEDFVRFATINPCKLLKIKNDNYLQHGEKISFTIWDKQTLKPNNVFIKGE